LSDEPAAPREPPEPPKGREESLERRFLYLVSGRRQGWVAALARAGLRVFSWFFCVAAVLRAWLYQRKIAKVHRVGRPVVSIGNLTTGGTGKTPMVDRVVRELTQRGFRPAIISRGYGAEKGEPNDEARLLRERLPDTPHLQDPDRVRAARAAIRHHQATALVLDDAFQHRRLHRDLDIVLLDATNPFGYGYLLPRGLLREPPTALRRAHLCVITRADLVPEDQLEKLRAEIGRIAPDLPIACASLEPRALLPLEQLPNDEIQDEETLDAELRGRPVFAFCAIGNPSSFFAGLRALGAEVVGTRAFGDHARYDTQTVVEVLHEARRLGADLCITTHKDAVKVRPLDLPPPNRHNGTRPVPPIYVLHVDLGFRSGAADWQWLLEERIGRPEEPAS